MPINNLNNTHLTAAQMTAIDDALTAFETAVETLTATLTAAERQIYGSINEQNKLLVNKVWDYRVGSPNLSAPDLDWVEYEKDRTSRLFLENAHNRLLAIDERLTNSKILHDYDNYQSALDDYAYTTYKAGSNAPGFETKMQELKQFFVSRANRKPPVEKPSGVQ